MDCHQSRRFNPHGEAHVLYTLLITTASFGRRRHFCGNPFDSPLKKSTQAAKWRNCALRVDFWRKLSIMSFLSLGLKPEPVPAVSGKGYDLPIPIKAKAIPLIPEGRASMGSAQTGMGKTARFTLPILQRLAAWPASGS